MADTRVEYRFVLDAYTPETIPQARLAEYLADLAALYGETEAVHFVRLEASSLAVVSAVDTDADADVEERIHAADSDDAPPDVRKTYETLRKRVAEDNGSAYITRNGARVLAFPTGELLSEAPTYGPFWQAGHISGTVILVGGKGDPVSVRLLDANGQTFTCKANRGTAKRLSEFLFEQPVRVTGQGKWRREPSGRWRLEQFNVDGFIPLDDEPLAESISRLRAIDARWKRHDDPLAELDAIRRGD